MFMFETQPAWYHIRPFDSLGWHVGFWNVIGALGFMLCGVFGIAEAQPWAEYQSGCATFWGSWAFLIGSICQWIECLNRWFCAYEEWAYWVSAVDKIYT
jgi:hypothetical protein